MPTPKQEAVARDILRDNPSKPVGKAMLDAGYSRRSAVAPTQNLLSSDGWKELVAKYLPQEDIAKVHRQMLHNKDWRANSDAIDKYYKITGKYQQDADVTFNAPVQIIVKQLTPQDEARVKGGEK